MRIDAMSRVYDAYKVQGSLPSKKIEHTQSKDEVTLSSEAKDFATLTKLLSKTPDVRTDRVEDLKNQISSGTYTVRAEEVAEKIISQLDIRG